MSGPENDADAPHARLDRLLRAIEKGPETPVRAQARAVVRAVLDLHTDVLARMMALASSAEAPGRPLIEAFARDPVVAGGLLLHGLHPVDPETRVHDALAAAAPTLVEHGARIAHVTLEERGVHVVVEREAGRPGAPAAMLRAVIEDALVAAAPELPGIRIDGPADAAAWVPVDQVRLRPREASTRP